MKILIRVLYMGLLSNTLQGNGPQNKHMIHNHSPKQTGHYVKSGSRLCESMHPKEERENPRIKKDGDFQDLVTDSTVFADKSLFIKTVIEDSSTGLLIAMPRRWGKTVNLDMLKRFLELPGVDENGESIDRASTANYKIFRQPCVLRPDNRRYTLGISRSKIHTKDPNDPFKKQYVNALDLQGTYPVVYIDFKDCKAGDFNSIKKLVSAELRDSFNQHAYLRDSAKLSDAQRELIKQYLREGEHAPVERGLKVLSQALHDHYGKRVWILIDEYDAALNEAYRDPGFSTRDLKSTITLFQRLYEAALKSNKSLEKAVVTGIQFIAKASAGSGLNNLEKIDNTNAQYASYYGLSQEEFEWFCNHFRVPERYLERAKAWYDGYTVRTYDQQEHLVKDEVSNKYNVWSVVSYLKDGDFKNFKSYWEDSGSIDFLQDLFKSPAVRDKIEQLLDEKDGQPNTISFKRESSFSDKDFDALKNMMGGNKVVGEAGVNIVFSYLFTLGYLTVDGLKHNAYRLPNMEIRYEMEKRLLSYYETLYTVDPERIQKVINVMQHMMSINQPHQENRIQALLNDFYGQFKGIIQAIQLVDNVDDVGIFMNEDVIHSVLNYIALQTQHETFGSEIYTRKLNSNERGRVDLKIANNRIGILIEVKCVPIPKNDNGHMQAALTQARSYRNALKTNNNMFIAINVEKRAALPTERRIELLCDSDMFAQKNTFSINAAGEIDTL